MNFLDFLRLLCFQSETAYFKLFVTKSHIGMIYEHVFFWLLQTKSKVVKDK